MVVEQQPLSLNCFCVAHRKPKSDVVENQISCLEYYKKMFSILIMMGSVYPTQAVKAQGDCSRVQQAYKCITHAIKLLLIIQVTLTYQFVIP